MPRKEGFLKFRLRTKRDRLDSRCVSIRYRPATQFPSLEILTREKGGGGGGNGRIRDKRGEKEFGCEKERFLFRCDEHRLNNRGEKGDEWHSSSRGTLTQSRVSTL